MRFLPTRIHGVLDYLMGVVLIVAPWLLNYAGGEPGIWEPGPATWVPTILGAGVLMYSILTDYELGAVRVVPMPVHLAFDGVGGLILAASPWLFGFAEFVWLPHLLLGLLEIGAALTTQTAPGHVTRGARPAA